MSSPYFLPPVAGVGTAFATTPGSPTPIVIGGRGPFGGRGSGSGHNHHHKKMSTTHICCIVLFVLLLVGLLVMLLWPYKTYKRCPASGSAIYVDDALRVGAANGKVHELESAEEAMKVLEGKSKALLMVHATWCGHCRSMMPALEECAKTSPVPVYRIEAGKAQALMSKYDIKGFPTLFGVSGGSGSGSAGGAGSAPKRYSGARTAAALLDFCKGL